MDGTRLKGIRIKGVAMSIDLKPFSVLPWAYRRYIVSKEAYEAWYKSVRFLLLDLVRPIPFHVLNSLTNK